MVCFLQILSKGVGNGSIDILSLLSSFVGYAAPTPGRQQMHMPQAMMVPPPAMQPLVPLPAPRDVPPPMLMDVLSSRQARAREEDDVEEDEQSKRQRQEATAITFEQQPVRPSAAEVYNNPSQANDNNVLMEGQSEVWGFGAADEVDLTWVANPHNIHDVDL